MTILALRFSHLWIAIVIAVAHWLIDIWKMYQREDTLVNFALDQLGHILVIVMIYLGFNFNCVTHAISVLQQPDLNVRYIAIIGTGFALTSPAGLLIGLLTKRWSGNLDISSANSASDNTLPKAGKWIGILERLLIFTFVLLGRIEVVGFLITAKSILRFNDTKHSEYILIGTLISYVMAIGGGLICSSIK